MQFEKDAIMREIQRLNLFLERLLSRSSGTQESFHADFQEIDTELKNEFRFGLSELADLTKKDLLEYLDTLDKGHIEKIAELMIMSTAKENLSLHPKASLQAKNILDYLDEKSNTYSFKRLELRNRLRSE